MKAKVYILSSIMMTLFLVCCNSAQNKDEIESIYVLFYNSTFTTDIAIDCDQIKKNIPPMDTTLVVNQHGDSIGIMVNNYGVLDAIMTNPVVLKDIANELRNLQADSASNYSFDARISCFIKYKNKKEERLCIGGEFTDDILYNGMRQKTNNKLLYLIKQNIGYYSWIDDRFLEYYYELQDKSFKRDSVVGYFGRKF